MAEPASVRMTADDFVAWAMTRPEKEHDERADGEVLAMAPERAEHADGTILLDTHGIVLSDPLPPL